MRNTAIFVNKIELKRNDGEISHTTSQHATLDRHDRSIPRDVPRDKGLYPVNIFIPWDNFWFIPLQPYSSAWSRRFADERGWSVLQRICFCVIDFLRLASVPLRNL